MREPRPEVIVALRETAARLREGAPYQWGHAGQCNCGHLAQTVTALDDREIYRMVAGEWSEHLNVGCPVSGLDLDDVAARLVRFGFSTGALADLEQLRNREVLRYVEGGAGFLRRNDRTDVVRYLEAWADMLEDTRVESHALA
jgi:hypothetical protein